MGKYLNSPMTYMACEETIRNPYFVDKSKSPEEILAIGTNYNKYLCITGPRRFGKTVMANALAAGDDYRVEREDKAGTGYVDFIFYPQRDKHMDCMILELKADATPEEAIRQIRSRNYMMKFQGKTGESPRYTGRILLVGIDYYKKDKSHRCVVEVLQNPNCPQ